MDRIRERSWFDQSPTGNDAGVAVMSLSLDTDDASGYRRCLWIQTMPLDTDDAPEYNRSLWIQVQPRKENRLTPFALQYSLVAV